MGLDRGSMVRQSCSDRIAELWCEVGFTPLNMAQYKGAMMSVKHWISTIILKLGCL
jgi:hypothetical protein